VGNAIAHLCVEGQEFRSWRNKCPQRQIAPLATLARDPESLRRTVHKLLREQALPDGTRPPVWFAFDEARPLAFFAGTWTRWTSVRRVKEGETTNDLFAFLTTEPNKVVGAIHPKAMPVILATREEIDVWMSAPAEEALKLQRPLAYDALMIVARGEKKDEGGLASATARNSAPSGQLVGNWTRMRAICSITRAPILTRRSRSVANSQRASGFVCGIAERTQCISQNAAVWSASRT
jgi:SOS response associated peptidase (SRAP)